MKYLLLVALFITAASVAQKRDTVYDKVDLNKLKKQIDSSTRMMDTLFDQQYKRIQEEGLQRTLEQNDRNLDAFVRMQKEREAKEKKAMWVRLGLGVFFLGVLIFGLMRRRKKAN